MSISRMLSQLSWCRDCSVMICDGVSVNGNNTGRELFLVFGDDGRPSNNTYGHLDDIYLRTIELTWPLIVCLGCLQGGPLIL